MVQGPLPRLSNRFRDLDPSKRRQVPVVRTGQLQSANMDRGAEWRNKGHTSTLAAADDEGESCGQGEDREKSCGHLAGRPGASYLIGGFDLVPF